jgi:hypothetical protein
LERAREQEKKSKKYIGNYYKPKERLFHPPSNMYRVREKKTKKQKENISLTPMSSFFIIIFPFHLEDGLLLSAGSIQYLSLTHSKHSGTEWKSRVRE